jgi:hypothetical protein
MDYSNLCQRVMDLDPGIRFAGICDNTGENVYGGQRVGVKNILSKEETRQANLQALATWALYLPLELKVGRGKYAMVEFEKIKRISVPLDKDHLLVVTTEVDIDHENMIKAILNFRTSDLQPSRLR